MGAAGFAPAKAVRPADLQSAAFDYSATPPKFCQEPEVGLEPTTYALQMRCSTVELLRLNFYVILAQK